MAASVIGLALVVSLVALGISAGCAAFVWWALYGKGTD